METLADAPGIMKVLTAEDRPFYDAEEVSRILGISKSKAYVVIRALRDELVGAGKLTAVYPTGKIPKRYFNERCGL